MFKTLFTQLCVERNVSPAFVMKELGYSNSVYSKWNDKTLPRPSTLIKVAEYFGVSVAYLRGEEDNTAVASLALGEVMEWLEDNEYEVNEDENNVYSISKNGKSRYVPNSDLVMESLAIKETAKDGFELAMLDWERRNFGDCYELNEQEKAIIRLLRSTSEDGVLDMIAALKDIQRDVEKKKNTATDKKAIG